MSNEQGAQLMPMDVLAEETKVIDTKSQKKRKHSDKHTGMSCIVLFTLKNWQFASIYGSTHKPHVNNFPL